MEPGTRVRYNGSWYPGLAGKNATVVYSDAEYNYVTFDYKPHLKNLPCDDNELEVL